MPSVVNTDPILSVPKCNWCTKRNDYNKHNENDQEWFYSDPIRFLGFLHELLKEPIISPLKFKIAHGRYIENRSWPYLCRAMLCISAAYAVMRCMSVCLSVTFVDHVKMNKHIFEFFSPSGSHTILVFSYQTGWRYSDGNPPNGGVKCRWGIGRNRDYERISGTYGISSTASLPRNADWSISWPFPYQFAPKLQAVC